jgi:hypothetical protein
MNEREPGNFLQRWSRRKYEATAESTVPEQSKAKPESAAPPEATDHDASDKPFNLADLPSIESIDAKTDIRAFLQAGVPSELKHAALRRAWSADPQIRDFIGPVENGWDFNAPEGILGFGELPAGEDIARLLTQAIGAPASQQEPVQNAPAETAALSGSSPSDQALPHEQPNNTLDVKTPSSGAPLSRMNNDSCKDGARPNDADIASQHNLEPAAGNQCAPPRRHGGALPK